MSLKCIWPSVNGDFLGNAEKIGIPSSAIFTFPDEPRILKFLAFSDNSEGNFFSSINFKKVRFASKFETTALARIISPETS